MKLRELQLHIDSEKL